MSKTPGTAEQPQRIRRPAGATRKKRIVGRGAASGHGHTAGRGNKGQRSRAGSGVRAAFEGGQMPLYRRIARRGFSNHPFRTVYQTVDVRDLNRFADGDTIDRQKLLDAGVISKAGVPVKLLGSGELERTLTVLVDRVSAGARQKVVAVGGSLQMLGEAQPIDYAPDGTAAGGTSAPAELLADGPASEERS